MAVWPVSIFSRWLKTLQCSCASNNFLSPRMLFLCYNCTHLSLSMTLFPPSVYALTLPISILPFLLHFPHKEPFGLSLLFSCWFPPSLPHSLPLVNVPPTPITQGDQCPSWLIMDEAWCGLQHFCPLIFLFSWCFCLFSFPSIISLGVAFPQVSYFEPIRPPHPVISEMLEIQAGVSLFLTCFGMFVSAGKKYKIDLFTYQEPFLASQKSRVHAHVLLSCPQCLNQSQAHSVSP